jgi:Zn-dependent peptidase ImmA (M78 family)
MARSASALVKPELLAWARVSAGFSSVEQVAELTDFHSLTLEEWESGHALPTIAELRKLAAVYKRPIAVFFLDEAPTRFDAQREFRRLAGTVSDSASPDLLLALRWALFRREAAMELHRLTGEPPGQLDVTLDPDLDPEDAGQKIRELLGLSWDDQLEWKGAYAALSGWRSAIEAKGVLVFQTSDVTLEEMRATCVPDQPLPVILLNAKDAPHGRVFSLLHEFAHILLHAGGHQTSRMVGERSPEEQPLEVAANAFAAAALLPKVEFKKVAARHEAAAEGNDSPLRELAQKVKVSPEVILRRLVTLGISSESIYRRKRTDWGSRLWYVPAPSKGGPPVEVKTIAKDGPAYTRLVLDAYDDRIINTSAASDYLGVKPRHFANIRRS